MIKFAFWKDHFDRNVEDTEEGWEDCRETSQETIAVMVDRRDENLNLDSESGYKMKQRERKGVI